jgi:hypothetical protein
LAAFTFEKISPPVSAGSAAVDETEETPRGLIVQMVERVTKRRAPRGRAASIADNQKQN